MSVLINNDQQRNRFSDTKGNVVKLGRFASCIKTSPYTPCLSPSHTSITNYLKPYTLLSYIITGMSVHGYSRQMVNSLNSYQLMQSQYGGWQ